MTAVVQTRKLHDACLTYERGRDASGVADGNKAHRWHTMGKMCEGKEALTTRNLPNTASTHQELVLVYLDLNDAALYVKAHVHASSVLGALHLIGTEFNEAPAHEVILARRTQFGIFEGSVSDFDRIDCLWCPSNSCQR